MRENDPLTARELRAILDYDLETGVFTWKIDRGIKTRAGDIAGYAGRKANKDGKPYVVIHINRKEYRANRLAWLHFYGKWSNGVVDHENGDTLKNSISNLRDATDAQNKINTPVRKNNTLGHKGIRYRPRRSKPYHASIYSNFKETHLGAFLTFEEAKAAYVKAALTRDADFLHSSMKP